MKLVAGVDSSTQSCKVVIRDLITGEVVRSGHAKHPDGTEVDPNGFSSPDSGPAMRTVNDIKTQANTASISFTEGSATPGKM